MPFLLQFLVFVFNFTALALKIKLLVLKINKEFCLEKLNMCSRLEKTCVQLFITLLLRIRKYV